MAKIYNLFISHSWSYNDDYERLKGLLDSCSDFHYRDYSVPKYDPVHNANSSRELRDAIRNQMKPASCILVLAGVYSTYSRWINIEIELAEQMHKKIIAVEGLGAERTSTVVKEHADKIVKWRASSIIEAIIEE